MCVATPGKLISLNGCRGLADIRGNRLTVELGLVQAKPGDYLLIHAGCAISVISRDEAQELSELLALVNDNGTES